MESKVKHLMYVPFTGLGLFNGFRGQRFLRNRITVFKEYVIPSLQAQTSKNFTLWISWRREEKTNPIVKELMEYMEGIKEFKTIHTFAGVCFYDDKYPVDEARNRLVTSLHASMPVLLDEIGEVDSVLMTVQPSDDCYNREMVHQIQEMFKHYPDFQAIGYSKGFICNVNTKEISEYNPKTNPPFYTIKFPRDTFTDPLKHLAYTALKEGVEGYKKDTPLPSHEWIGQCLNYGQVHERGFLVNCHGENISTYYDHPYKGEVVDTEYLGNFGVLNSPKLHFKLGWKRWILKHLPHPIRRKVRYWFTEKIYNWLRT